MNRMGGFVMGCLPTRRGALPGVAIASLFACVLMALPVRAEGQTPSVTPQVEAAAVPVPLTVPAPGWCEACRKADVEQIGAFVAPDVDIRKGPDLDLELRGKPQKIPVPGAAPVTVRLKPGVGVWLSGVGPNLGDVFVAGARTGAKAQWRIGF